MDLERVLQGRGITRKEFLRWCAATAAALGLSELYAPKVAEAVGQAAKKPPVVWIKGQDCTGCTESAISDLSPSPEQLVLDLLSFRYHPTIMAASGDEAQQAFRDVVKEGGYLLVVEGAIPSKDNRFAMEAGEPFVQHLREAAQNAVAVVAAGSCAAYGGIPGAGPTGSKGVSHFVKDKPVINVPSCPVKPSRLVGTVMHYLMFKKLPALDAVGRPVPYYGYLQHDNCPRRGHFERGEFLEDWNNSAQSQYCLLLKGCKGPSTYTDCALLWWNDGANYCINAGSPCSGCTQPEFYAGFSPLYQRQEQFRLPGIGGVSTDTIGGVLVGSTAVALAGHAVLRGARGSKETEAKSAGKGSDAQ